MTNDGLDRAVARALNVVIAQAEATGQRLKVGDLSRAALAVVRAHDRAAPPPPVPAQGEAPRCSVCNRRVTSADWHPAHASAPPPPSASPGGEPERRTWYIEARVGSENYRGDCVRFIDDRRAKRGGDGHYVNRPAEEVLAEAFAEIARLKAAPSLPGAYRRERGSEMKREEAIECLRDMAERWTETEAWHDPPFHCGKINVSTRELHAAAVLLPLLSQATPAREAGCNRVCILAVRGGDKGPHEPGYCDLYEASEIGVPCAGLCHGDPRQPFDGICPNCGTHGNDGEACSVCIPAPPPAVADTPLCERTWLGYARCNDGLKLSPSAAAKTPAEVTCPKCLKMRGDTPDTAGTAGEDK